MMVATVWRALYWWGFASLFACGSGFVSSLALCVLVAVQCRVFFTCSNILLFCTCLIMKRQASKSEERCCPPLCTSTVFRDTCTVSFSLAHGIIAPLLQYYLVAGVAGKIPYCMYYWQLHIASIHPRDFTVLVVLYRQHYYCASTVLKRKGKSRRQHFEGYWGVK